MNPDNRVVWNKRFIEPGSTYSIAVSAIGSTSYFLGNFNGKTVIGKQTFDRPAQIILVESGPRGRPIKSWSLIQFSGTRDESFSGTLQAIDIPKQGRRFYNIVAFSGTLTILNNNMVTASGMGNELLMVTQMVPRSGEQLKSGNPANIKAVFFHHLSGTLPGSQIIVDDLGNSYVIGTFQTALFMDGKQIFTTVDTDYFILKFDPTGVLLWFQRGLNDGRITGNTISLLSTSQSEGSGQLYRSSAHPENFRRSKSNPSKTSNKFNLVAAGTFRDKITLGDTTLVNNDTMFTSWVGILTPEGKWLHAFSIKPDPRSVIKRTQPEFLTITSIGTDPNGNIYTTGEMSGTFIFGTISLTLEPDGIFVAKWSPLGDLIWVRNILTKIPLESGSHPLLIVDTGGNTYVSGYSWDGVRFQSNTEDIHNRGSGALDLFVAQLSPNGDWLWDIIFPGVIDINSNLIAVGNSSPLLMMKNHHDHKDGFGISPLFITGTNLVNENRKYAFISRIITTDLLSEASS